MAEKGGRSGGDRGRDSERPTELTLRDTLPLPTPEAAQRCQSLCSFFTASTYPSTGDGKSECLSAQEGTSRVCLACVCVMLTCVHVNTDLL